MNRSYRDFDHPHPRYEVFLGSRVRVLMYRGLPRETQAWVMAASQRPRIYEEEFELEISESRPQLPQVAV